MTTAESIREAFSRYDVREVWVPWVDNDGEACDFCQELDAVVEATVTGHSRELDADGLSNDCCSDCVRRLVVERCDASHPVRIEWSETQARLNECDDRMSGPDDDRPHPDGM